MTRASLFVILCAAAGLAAAILVPAMPQPVAYHDFADRRAVVGVANFLDVLCNAGFMVCRMLSRRVLDPAATAALRAATDRAPRVPPPADFASAP